MIDKRKILQAVINGDATALNKLPPITFFCTTDNRSKGIYQVTPQYGQNLPRWVKSKMTKGEIEAVKNKHNVLCIILEKTYE